ncbi:hypothetical protein J4228_02055, partial [Candidatus Woesearchaeota archaeon]|nr:hypothetical protein [Candidatus Woesearchaeota archaeon]
MHPKRSETKGQRRIARQALVIFVLCLFLNLPVVSALQISNVRAENITANSAVIRWETDAPADGFVEYGLKKETLQRTGDANLLTDHQFLLSNLHAETAYLYKVESDDVSEDNDGNLYPFTTLPPDVTAPLLEASLPPRVQGTKMTFSGSSEPGASIALLVNGVTSGTAVADSAGNFSFSDVILQGDQNNEIRLTARDAAGNEAVLTQGVFSDIHKPKITFEKIPEVVEDDSFTLKGTISENSSFEIVANNKSAALGEGTTVEATISLEEGENKITILLTDAAGWEAEEMFTLVSDTKKPFIDAEIERGHEYYEGRAQSSIHGTTEPGSMVFLYIYKPLGYEFKPDFKQARAVATADEKGEFTFEDVNFARTIADITLEDLVPKEVPPGLAEVTIFPIKEVAEQQQFSYYVYLIAEDTTGKTDFWQETVTVLACGSGLDFSVTPGFQGPLRLVPELIDNGQQKISTVLEFSYRGSGVAKMANGEEVEKGYKITSIRVDKACTKSMQEDEEFGIGCKILPNAPQTRIVSPDGASAYLEWKLHSSEEFTKSEDDFWNDLKKRRVVFPLKITINYQERQGDETYSGQKVQTTCTDVGYLVDIPANVEEFIPDNILDGSIDFLNETITVMEKVTEVVKNVYLYTAISAVVALGLQQVARWGRILSSKLEYYFTVVKAGKEEGEGCPLNQNELYMKDTIDDWQGVKNIPKKVAEASGDEEKLKKITLEERCPTTAGWWEFEEITNTVYRWTWDRAYCREVPARWTEDKEVEEIQKVILSQQQCAVTGRGVPLQKQENCRDLVRQNPAALPLYYSVNNVSTSCWKTVDGTLYVRKSESLETPQEKEDTKHGIFRLVPVGTILGELVPSREDLIAFKPEGAEDYFVARDQTCQNVCSNPRKPNYKSVGCVAEELQSDGTIQIKVKEGQYAAGYTKDCRPFARGSLQSSQVQQQPQDAGQVAPPGGEIAAAAQEAAKAAAQVAVQQSSQQLQYDASGRPTFEQCVCEGEKEEVQKYENQDYSLRTAEPEEEWSYREERIFKESIKQKGTYYPEQRYYDGRDFSGAFGANYLIDYFREEPREASIKPHASDTV